MKRVLLGDVAEIIKGISYRSADYSDSENGTAFVNLKSVARGGGYNPDGIKYYVGQIKPSQYVKSGDILIANTDLTQNREIIGSPIIMPDMGRSACFSLDLSKIIVTDTDMVYPRYLFYYLKSPIVREYMLAHSNGSTVMHLSVKAVPNMEINLPPLDQQKKIANILGSLDEKIELNRRMNETLEQLGQALFRHYFVDNPESKNWRRGVVSDLGEVVTGKTPSKKNQKFFGNEVAFLKVPDMHKASIVIKTSDNLSPIGAGSQKSKYIPKWSTCISCIATVGVVSLAGKNMQTNQQINSIVPREACFKFFNYFLMQHKSDYIKTLASSGSATPNLNRGHFSSITVVMPDRELLKEFDTRVSHLFLQMENNLQENETLINIRDALLPKLISGEIEV